MHGGGDFEATMAVVCEQWNKAEKVIKLAEQVNGEIVNPAIYELRYAGRRLVEAYHVKSHDQTAARKLLEDAFFHCCRAQHDAIDAATAKIAADLDIAVDKIGPEIVLDKYPDIHRLNSMLSQVRARIAESRERRHDRDAIYASIAEADLPGIVDLFGSFKSSESLMRAAAKRVRWWNVISFGTGLVGVIVGLAALFK